MQDTILLGPQEHHTVTCPYTIISYIHSRLSATPLYQLLSVNGITVIIRFFDIYFGRSVTSVSITGAVVLGIIVILMIVRAIRICGSVVCESRHEEK